LIMMGVSLMTPFLAGGLVGVTAPGIQNALRFIPGPGMLRHLKPSTPSPRQGGPGGSGYLKRWGKS
jgi:type IV secretion system protein VirB6